MQEVMGTMEKDLTNALDHEPLFQMLEEDFLKLNSTEKAQKAAIIFIFKIFEFMIEGEATLFNLISVILKCIYGQNNFFLS